MRGILFLLQLLWVSSLPPFLTKIVPKTGSKSGGRVKVFTSNALTEAPAMIEEEEDKNDDLEPEARPHAGAACVPTRLWSALRIGSFESKQAIDQLASNGLRLAEGGEVTGWPKWAPNGDTGKRLAENPQADGDDVYVWTGSFGSSCHGSELPAIRTQGVIPKSAKDITELLMDSSRVKVYNSMSLGRKDLKVFQSGIHTKSKLWGEGETKIVENRTKPPLTSKTLVFQTLMHARVLSDGRYLVVSRAVTDGSPSADGEVQSEIILGVNILAPLSDTSCRLTSITHVNSPLVPKMMAQSVGVKGAINFINDMRSLP